MDISASQTVRIPPRQEAFRLIAAASCAVIAIANGLFTPALPEGMALWVAPAMLMIISLLVGWLPAALCAGAIVLESLLFPQLNAWPVSSSCVMAVLCGEALRRGARPLLACAAQFFVTLAASIPSLRSGTFSETLELVTSVAANAGINVALATAALVWMPRRSDRFPCRCRIRWDHTIFALVVGTVSITTLGLLAGAHIEAHSPENGAMSTLSLRLGALLALALAFTCALTRWCESVSHGMMERYKASSSIRSLLREELPRDIAGFFLGVTRTTKRLRRGAERVDRDLLSAREAHQRMAEELKRTRELLSRKSTELRELALIQESALTRLNLLMETCTDVLLFVGADGRIQSASASLARELGYEPAALKGKPVNTLIPADCVLEHPLDRAKLAEGSAPTEALVKTRDGASRAVQVQAHPYRLRGEDRYLVRIAPDSQGRIARPPANAEADPSRDVFIATMSHELRTPLHGLIATLDMLRSSDPSTPDFQRQLSIARTSARALLKIANDILDLTRIGSGVFPLERKVFSLSSLLRELIDEVRARAVSLGLDLCAEIPDGLPLSFLGDPARIKQIVGNLVSNALKFTASGRVRVLVRYDGRACTIDVEDTGEGIPEDKRESIFFPFVQVESRSGREVGGTGLGLPISRRLAEAMGGQLVLLQSGPRGSVFRVTLPLEASEEPPPDEQSQRVFKNPHGRVLVVEDNAANRYVAEALLTGLQCPATIVASGREALELLQGQEFDLILMDCQMPGMDGYETTRRVRALLSKKVPIIAMTANAMAEDRKLCLEAGMDDFLPKPFGRQALNEVLCKWLTDAGSASVRATASLETAMQTLPVLDESVLQELWRGLQHRPSRLHEIGTTFRQSAERMAALLGPDGTLDRRALQRQLHTVLGSSGMVGARQIEYFSGRIQAALKTNRQEDLKDAAGILLRAVRRYDAAFDKAIGDIGASGTPASGFERGRARSGVQAR